MRAREGLLTASLDKSLTTLTAHNVCVTGGCCGAPGGGAGMRCDTDAAASALDGKEDPCR